MPPRSPIAARCCSARSTAQTLSGGLTGPGGLVQNGPAVLVLSVSNGYTGGTTIGGSVLQLGNSAALGAQTGSLAMSGGTLDMHGYNPTVGALTGNSFSMIGNLNGSTSSTLTTNSAVNSTYAGAFVTTGGGAVSLVMAGSGDLTLPRTGSGYIGTTAVTAGTLEVARITDTPGALSIPTGALALGGGATPATLRLTGNYNSSTGRTITLNGPATIEASEGQPGNYALALNGPVTSSGNQSLTLTGTNEGDLNGQVNLGAGTLTVNGSGPSALWVVSGTANTIGATVVNSGLLQLAGTSGLALGSGPVTINGGALDASIHSQQIGALTVGSLGSLDLSLTNTLTTGLATLGGTLNLFGATSGTEDLINYTGGYSGSFGTATNVPAGYKLQYNTYQLDLVASTNATTYNLAASTTASLLHVGDTATVSATITNAGTGQPDTLNYSGLGVSGPGSFSAAISGSASGGPLAQYGVGTITQTYTASVPGYNITLTPVSGGTNATLGTPALAGSTAVAMVNVFSGSGTWTGTGGTTSWSNNGNWADAHGVKAAPGTFAKFTNTDAAIFGGTTGGTITLDGASPSLNALTFSGSNASYTIAQAPAPAAR